MCGRYSLAMRLDQVRDRLIEDGIVLDEFSEDEQNNYYPSNNVHPTSRQPVIFRHGAQHSLTIRTMMWCFQPPWTHKIDKSHPIFNARSDNLTSRMWAGPFQKGGRCLVPVQGYYEWLHSNPDGKSKPKPTTPYYVRPCDANAIMYLAGLYSVAYIDKEPSTATEGRDKQPEREPLYSFAIVTTSPTESLEFLHPRMPLVLFPGTAAFDDWLNPEFKPTDKLQRFNVNSEISCNITASKAEIYLSGPKSGQPIVNKNGLDEFLNKNKKGVAAAEIKTEDENQHKRIKNERIDLHENKTSHFKVTPEQKSSEVKGGHYNLRPKNQSSPKFNKSSSTPAQKSKITSFFTKIS
ncbi:hypothetical protein V1514DRAFT_345378 [Lipomyces japonicus]|uniref:uncharacterized protein n=1 Tax=Lipomyces japonicus TaxID=56871 RepID=UPI0034CDE964